MPTSDEQSFEVALNNRLHAVWEKCEALTLAIYNANDGWIERRPTTAPRTLRKMAEDFLEVACELDAIARDVAAADKRFAESQAATCRTYAETIARFERDKLTSRLGEIARTARKPSGLAP
jgi:hypothetical protein